MAGLLLIHAVAAVGGLAGKRLRVPAGALVGSMLFVAALNIITGTSHNYPADLRALVQVFSGAVIGLTFKRADVITLRRLLLPAMILVTMMIGFNVLFAFVISNLTALDPITSLFASAPGGVSDIALISADFGADTKQVAVLQIFRFVFIVSLFPFIVRRLIGKNDASPVPMPVPAMVPDSTKNKLFKSAVTLLVAGAGAILARGFGLPAGAIIGSLAATVILSTVFQAAYLPKWTRVIVQICAGCFIGSQIAVETLAELQLLFLPMLLVIIQLGIMCFCASWVLRRFCRMDRATSIFSSIPGGTMEMSIIAAEMGLRVPEIVLMNTCRIIGVIFMMPVLLFLFGLFF